MTQRVVSFGAPFVYRRPSAAAPETPTAVRGVGEALASRAPGVAIGEETYMAADDRLLTLFNYYRDAEIRGATLLLKLLQRLDDPDAQVKLSKHLEEETHHAWLWTKRIT